MSERMTQEDAERMDASQAVQILKPLRTMMLDRNGCPISEAYFALGKAIEALEQPTVDAVPVEWIQGFMDWLDSKGYTIASAVIQKMLNDFRADGGRRSE